MITQKLKSHYQILLLIIFAIIVTFLSLNYHNKIPLYNYHSEIFSDKAGYYSYLPATFIYGFDASKFPKNIDKKTGEGFFIENKKLKTKYTCGVAILQSPFFLIAHTITNIFGLESTGFSVTYHYLIYISSIFYLLCGLMCLYFFLKQYFRSIAIIASLFILFAATNLYYYTIKEAAMSHVYSFALFSFLLLTASNFIQNDKKLKYFILFCIALSLITLIRPINFIIGLSIFFIEVHSLQTFKQRIFSLFKWKYAIIFTIIFFIIISPQLFYWKYLYGSFFVYSYEQEGFIYWNKPKVLHVLFSPLNGLLPYTPIWLLIFVSFFLYVKNNKWLASFILFIFFLVIYLAASWHSWHFGCAYGMRTMTEYLALFSLPFTFLVEKVLYSHNNRLKKRFLLLVVLLFIYFNIRMLYVYDGCFYGKSDWDWHEYYMYISKNKLFFF